MFGGHYLPKTMCSSLGDPPPKGRSRTGAYETLYIYPPTLPPQMFTTSAQLLDLTDKKLMITLRDGRKIIGVLRAWDQVPNLVIQNTTERIFAGGMYCDVPRGILIVRGENVLLLGEIDLDREDDIPLPQRSYAELAPLQEIEKKELKRRDKVHRKKLRALGFEDEGEVLH
ncbi:putative small nuclear ribonucleo protein [Sphaerosporella brunnea]|uniref:U6 snRNA-associated Sm-like protein LSm1 n=1 Tax=Sphaerosporella brunnea TaxID=1250544 RepID=A0A5J5EFD7_9PEZI|nr:putative small nuclear ribonucleo protein [Sphaerosporella brunnea]